MGLVVALMAVGGLAVVMSSRIGDSCGGSAGGSEPRSGSGDHSMNGVRGGEASTYVVRYYVVDHTN
jgi:hypothetical protein